MSRVPWPKMLRVLCAAAVAAALLPLVAAYHQQGPQPEGPAGIQRQGRDAEGGRVDKELRDMLNYSANDFIVVTGHSGRVHAFQVLGHVCVREAHKLGNRFITSKPAPDSEKPRFIPMGNTPLTARFENEFVLELLALSPPAPSADEAKAVIQKFCREHGHRWGRPPNEPANPTIHLLDAEQSVLLSVNSVIRVEWF